MNAMVRRRMWSAGVCLALAALVFVAAQGEGPPGQPAVASAAAPDGQKIYTTRCASCHQVNGQGVTGVFPPLAGVDWVTGDPTRLARVVMHGLTGPITVNGQKYNGAMPPWGTFLKDDEMAALLTYIRSSWGNKASAVTAEQVQAIREAHKARKTPWTEKELAN